MTCTRPRKLVFITGNKHKLAEAKAILGTAIELQNQSPDLVEIQGSVTEVAIHKCQQAAIAVNGPALIEDTALEFHALNGLPGPYIRQFYSALGNIGLNKLLAVYEDKSATSICTIAFSVGPGAEPILFQGRTTGRIVPPRGSGGFAYDPIFEYEGHTYAEMDAALKNRVSDRYRAFEKLKAWLAETEEPYEHPRI